MDNAGTVNEGWVLERIQIKRTVYFLQDRVTEKGYFSVSKMTYNYKITSLLKSDKFSECEKYFYEVINKALLKCQN